MTVCTEARNEKEKPDQEAFYTGPRESESEGIRFTFRKGYPIILLLKAEVENTVSIPAGRNS